MRLGLIARQASRVAQNEAKKVGRVVALKIVFGTIGAIFIIIAIVFALIGLHVLLRQEVGDVLAAFYIAGGCLLFAIVFLVLSFRVRKKTNAALQAQRVEAIAEQAAKELRSVSPYVVLGAFVLGLLQGKK